MIKNLEELTIGKIIYLDGVWLGLRPYEVTEITESGITVCSDDDSTLTIRTITNCEDFPIFESLDEGKRVLREAVDSDITKRFDEYNADLSTFIETMIQSAFLAAQDPDHGDYNESEAIRKMVEAHFPKIEI